MIRNYCTVFVTIYLSFFFWCIHLHVFLKQCFSDSISFSLSSTSYSLSVDNRLLEVDHLNRFLHIYGLLGIDNLRLTQDLSMSQLHVLVLNDPPLHASHLNHFSSLLSFHFNLLFLHLILLNHVFTTFWALWLGLVLVLVRINSIISSIIRIILNVL